MFRRKPLPANSSVVPPSPTAAPPPPPQIPPPPPFRYSEHDQTLINASEEWNNTPRVKDDDDDNGLDWWDRSDDEDDVAPTKDSVTQQPQAYTAQSSTSPGPRVPQTYSTPQKVPQEAGNLGIGGLSINGAQPSTSVAKLETNPYHRKLSQDEQRRDAENPAAAWRQPSVPQKPPQLSMPSFRREPLSPKLFQDMAGGKMSTATSAPQALNQTLSRQDTRTLPQLDLIDFSQDETTQAPSSNTRRSRLDSDTNKEVVTIGENNAMMDTRSGFLMPSSQAAPRQAQVRSETVPHIEKPSGQSGPRAEVETPQSTARRQRSENYQIKHIRWYDPQSTENPRPSPILIQNANGPCPLLALVNALVLSTPALLITPLIETLRTRENISLGLLLDAVFDELMSERRVGGGNALPDVGELYAFLVTLHTGMNVNPRFVPRSDHNEEAVRGDFEETRETRLYTTFSIPLMHGWLPRSTDDAYSAFERLAPTYEDAQNMAFREAELEQKLQTEQLNDEEENLYIDLTSLKEFLTLWPTQLTDYGLETINKTLRPGQFGIFFRNDHFSTLYKEPRTGQLMTLVTDAGYTTHDEIVWESLVDINGSRNELFSGDFRSVSHSEQSSSQQEAYDGADGEWKTVASKWSRTRRAAGKAPARDASPPPNTADTVHAETSTTSAPPYTATPSTTLSPEPAHNTSQAPSDPAPRSRTHSEQDDHDLALALQLQEEEEQAQRAADETRRRDNELSERFLSQESSRQGPQIPPRRSTSSAPVPASAPSNNVSPAPPSHTPRRPPDTTPATPVRPSGTWRPPQHNDDLTETDGEEAPPTYEAATAAAKASTLPPQRAQRPQRPQLGSLYSQNSATHSNSNAHLPGSRVGQAGRRRLSNQQRVGRGGSYGGNAGGGGLGYGGTGSAPRGGYGQSPAGAVEEEKCVVM